MAENASRIMPGFSVDAQGNVLAPSGCRVARITPEGLKLYDKREKREVTMSPDSLRQLFPVLLDDQ